MGLRDKVRLPTERCPFDVRGVGKHNTTRERPIMLHFEGLWSQPIATRFMSKEVPPRLEVKRPRCQNHNERESWKSLLNFGYIVHLEWKQPSS